MKILGKNDFERKSESLVSKISSEKEDTWACVDEVDE
jgi:hypothetical protein